MKTKDFLESAKELECYVHHNKAMDDYILQSECLSTVYGSVSNRLRYFSVNHSASDDVADLICEYGMTPVEERVEEKKYYVKLKNDVLAYNMHGSYLNYSEVAEHYLFSNQESTRYYTSQFTQKQLDEMPDEVKAVIPLCEKIEIKETV